MTEERREPRHFAAHRCSVDQPRWSGRRRCGGQNDQCVRKLSSIGTDDLGSQGLATYFQSSRHSR